MPAIQKGSTVLVTGASGYIAAHVASQLLERGFTVRGTVRTKAKGEYLVKKLNNDKFSYVVVEDVEKEDGFDEAVKGVDAVAHIASPFHFNAKTPEELINPAVNGTLSILRAAKKNGDKVQRVVITSSFASILQPHDPVYTYTEADWNDFDPKNCEELGDKAEAKSSYRASKTLAEKAAWKFIETEKPQFDVSTICPPLVLGPLLHEVPKPGSLNTSVGQFHALLTGERKDEDLTGFAGFCVDVRDVAAAHIDALVTSSAGGNRFVVSKRSFSWQNVLDVVHSTGAGKLWPETSKGQAGKDVQDKVNVLDASKSKKELGLEYHSFDSTIYDMAESLKEYSKSW